jgi:hypothetical protein
MNSWEHRQQVEVYTTNGRTGLPVLVPTKLGVEAGRRNVLGRPFAHSTPKVRRKYAESTPPTRTVSRPGSALPCLAWGRPARPLRCPTPSHPRLPARPPVSHPSPPLGHAFTPIRTQETTGRNAGWLISGLLGGHNGGRKANTTTIEPTLWENAACGASAS